jgi:polar amino acid transport system substrate-binding protein
MKYFKKMHYSHIIVAIFFIAGSGLANAQELKVSMAFLPGILETPDKGVFVDLIKAIDDVFEGNIQRRVYPFPDSIGNVVSGKADFHLPMIRNKVVPEESLPYAYTTEKMGDVYFVIYSHKDNPITFERIQKAKNTKPFPLRIESEGGFLDYFDFPISESSGVKDSLQKVNFKLVNAFIFAQEECDFTVKQLKLKNVHREQYDRFDDVFVIPKGAKGKEIDAILSTCLQKLRSSGKLQTLHEKVHVPYQVWQPHEMGW